jgi:hypothetical protein
MKILFISSIFCFCIGCVSPQEHNNKENLEIDFPGAYRITVYASSILDQSFIVAIIKHLEHHDSIGPVAVYPSTSSELNNQGNVVWKVEIEYSSEEDGRTIANNITKK